VVCSVCKKVKEWNLGLWLLLENRGAVVGVTLVDEDKEELDMPAGLDEFAPRILAQFMRACRIQPGKIWNTFFVKVMFTKEKYDNISSIYSDVAEKN
jgi:hypothetical protein